MAKRIIWTDPADSAFTKILEYYIERNGSKAYSRKLNKKIKILLSDLLKQPQLGLKTEKKNYRVLISGNFRIFYEIGDNAIIVHLVWDARQNPTAIDL
jgi:plasmid stabilization system protein ParE